MAIVVQNAVLLAFGQSEGPLVLEEIAAMAGISTSLVRGVGSLGDEVGHASGNGIIRSDTPNTRSNAPLKHRYHGARARRLALSFCARLNFRHSWNKK